MRFAQLKLAVFLSKLIFCVRILQKRCNFNMVVNKNRGSLLLTGCVAMLLLPSLKRLHICSISPLFCILNLFQLSFYGCPGFVANLSLISVCHCLNSQLTILDRVVDEDTDFHWIICSPVLGLKKKCYLAKEREVYLVYL